MQRLKVRMTQKKLPRNVMRRTNQNSKLKRDVASAGKFVARIKSGEKIPLRTMLMMKNRLGVLHATIKPLARAGDAAMRKLEKDIDETFLHIARAKVRYEQKLKAKKKIRTFGMPRVWGKKKR